MQRMKARFPGSCSACKAPFSRNAEILLADGVAYSGDCADAVELSR